VCDLAEEEFAELLAWREAVSRAEAGASAPRRDLAPAELRRRLPETEPADAPA
jgi:hypothetical protein